MIDRQLAALVLQMLEQRTTLWTNEDVLVGVDRLEAQAPLTRDVMLNVPGIIVYLSGYTITRTSAHKGEDATPTFEASKEGDTGPVWDVAARLTGLSPEDQTMLFGHLSTRDEVTAAFRQLVNGADCVDWDAVHNR
jgi:hypothetical protein